MSSFSSYFDEVNEKILKINIKIKIFSKKNINMNFNLTSSTNFD